MAHDFCPECDNFVQFDKRGNFTCLRCGYNNLDNTVDDLVNHNTLDLLMLLKDLDEERF